MTPTEAKAAFREFKLNAGGSRPHLHVSIDFYDVHGGGALQATFYPFGMTGGADERITVNAGDFEALLDKLKAAWAEASERHHAARVRAMALAIIRITAEQGACTNAALRADEFTDDEVNRYGEDAIADANEIASNGPFSIVKLAGANAA